jgi:YidC/Oxa1 family membrane protein insertase
MSSARHEHEAKVCPKMSSPKRLVLFLVLSFLIMFGTQALMERMGLIPPPPPAQAPAPAANAPAANQPVAANNPPVAKADAKAPQADPAKPAAAAVGAPKVAAPPIVNPDELVLGSAADPSPGAYHMEVRFQQRGGGVRQLLLAQFDGETPDGVPDRKSRLQLIRPDPTFFPPSLSMILQPVVAAGRTGNEIALDTRTWEVVVEKPGDPAVRTLLTKQADGSQVESQEIAFRTVVDELGVTVTRRYRLKKGADGFEMDLEFEGTKDNTLSYQLFGAHNIPIEGEWYTSTFRDVFFGQVKGTKTEIITKTASDIVSSKSEPQTYTTLPLQFTGVENQYFAVFFEPEPRPTAEKRRDSSSMAVVAHENAKESQKSDVTVAMTSMGFPVGPNVPEKHSYKIFAGPKIAKVLEPYEATGLAAYRKSQWIPIPYTTEIAQYVIAPLLDRIYGMTTWVANRFGFAKGSYGIAIILLTMTVRLILFPLGRKQAMISKKMADLQPHLAVIKEKYKDDKEQQTRETMALYKAHGFNPAAGCLPALIQLPIFVGLWQALNNSVALRHSRFLYIQNLAAPDMLFSFGTDLPFLGKYFNLLPFLVVALMLIQTKLFTPPPMTEEARMQQKMMKYMMVFMAFMFYRVPSGLGIYFITSSLWQICERLLLPKITHAKTIGPADETNGSTAVLEPPTKPSGWFARKLEKLLEEAANERTIRNNGGSGRGTPPPPPERNRNRPRPGKRR